MNPHPVHTPQASDFRFQNHERTAARFDELYGYLKVYGDPPKVETLDGAIYTPASLEGKIQTGALFRNDGTRVDASINFSGRHQTTHSHEPQRIPVAPLDKQQGTFLYLGTFQPHYGHFITETLPRFWALEQYRRPGVKLLAHMPRPAMLQWTYVEQLLRYFGIAAQDIVYFDQACVVERVIVPETTLSLESHVHTEFANGMAPAVNQCLGTLPEQTEQPLFLSRRHLKKGVYFYKGQEELDELMAQHGAHVIYPEQLTIAEQIYLFNRHKNIVGIIGSAMHNVIYSQIKPNLYYLTANWVNPTCMLLDQCFAGEANYIQVCKSSDALKAGWERVVKRIPILSKRRINRFHYERDLDIKVLTQWVQHSTLFK